GRLLFHDARLSKDLTVSCATCHPLARGGADGMVHSRGVGGAVGSINTPTVLNAGFNFRQFWDGRAANLRAQVDGPLTNPAEMASDWPLAIQRLGADRTLVRAFQAIYPDGLKPENIRDAIAEFESSLVTPSRFDRWLRGSDSAISAGELAGYRLFKKYGCVSCHQGVNVGGNLYQRFGVMHDPFAEKGRRITRADLGRYNQTGREADKFVFKVPSLRNVALTAPYFHDGSAATLDEAVRIMGEAQLGLDLPKEDIAAIVRFLRTLSAEALP
ncbi:MAG: c-type cytochrome, partial [Zoogloea sp.]|nr:c-type cytochrome [Zoogloea sp.]